MILSIISQAFDIKYQISSIISQVLDIEHQMSNKRHQVFLYLCQVSYINHKISSIQYKVLISSKDTEFQFYSKNIQNYFAYTSATKYRSEAGLQSERTAGYPLSPHI